MCYQATRDHFAIETKTSIIRKIIKFPIYAIAKLIGKNYFQKKLQRLAGLKAYDKSKYIGCVVWLSGGEYDKVLRHTYGDYMKLPPKEERIGHHYYKVYQK